PRVIWNEPNTTSSTETSKQPPFMLDQLLNGNFASYAKTKASRFPSNLMRIKLELVCFGMVFSPANESVRSNEQKVQSCWILCHVRWKQKLKLCAQRC